MTWPDVDVANLNLIHWSLHLPRDGKLKTRHINATALATGPDAFSHRDKPDKKLLQKELTSALSLNLLPTKKIGQSR